MPSPAEILSAILERATDIDHIRSLVTPDVTYVSLNYSNLDLKKIPARVPPAAQRASSGPSWT
jgi:hypothetical protein